MRGEEAEIDHFEVRGRGVGGGRRAEVASKDCDEDLDDLSELPPKVLEK